MRTVRLGSEPVSAADLLRMAREGVILVTTSEGESFLIGPADDLDAEVESLRRNDTFLALLDELKGDPETIPLEEVEEQLR